MSRHTELRNNLKDAQLHTEQAKDTAKSAIQSAQADCKVRQASDLSLLQQEAQTRCNGMIVTIGQIPFDLLEPCLGVLNAKLTTSTVATVQIKVGNNEATVVDLHERTRKLTWAYPAPRAFLREPTALLSVGGIEWDLSAPLSQSVVRDLTVDVSLTIGTMTSRLTLSRAMAMEAALNLCAQKFLYDMPNGTVGSLKYTDTSYTVNGILSPDASVQGAMLRGGTGMLSDGRVASRRFYEPAMSPQLDRTHWVAWTSDSVMITFHLPPLFRCSSVLIFVSNEDAHGIRRPTAVRINGAQLTSSTDVPLGTIGWLTFPVALGPGGDCSIELVNGDRAFMFVSEVLFK